MTPSRPGIVKFELPTPYPVGDINAYFIDGDEPTLIDTGVYSSKSLDALKAHLHRQGRRLEDIRRILITHGHYDHAGAALYLSQTCRAKLCLHEKCILFNRVEKETLDRLLAFLLRAGIPAPLLDTARELFSRGGRLGNTEARPYAVEWLKGGEILSINGLSLEVLATPGHCPDHLCFLDNASGALLCGDTLLPGITPNPMLYFDPQAGFRRNHSLLQYLHSLDLLKTSGAAAGYPGHGRLIGDAPALIEYNETFIRERKESFIHQIRRRADTPYKLALSLFRELDPVNLVLAVSETVAYLDLIERDTPITVTWEEDPIVVRK